MQLQYEKDSKERIPYEHYMELFSKADPKEITQRTGVLFDEETSSFRLKFLGVEYDIQFPNYTVTHVEESKIGYYPLESAVNARILVLRYLVEGVKAPATGKFLTYRETPWGTVYLRQFQGRCIMRLAFGFGNKQEAFQKAMEKIEAKKLSYGDISYEFQVLDGFYLRMILWAGDDEFPPSAQILFSDNFPISFQAEDMAVVGDVTINMLKAIS